jgi:hypothetical protein
MINYDLKTIFLIQEILEFYRKNIKNILKKFVISALKVQEYSF